MKHDRSTPPVLAEHDGLAYALFLPDGEPRAGVVVLHGAGSCKENHYDFARVCVDHGLASLAYNARGHGASAGPLRDEAVDDVLAMRELLLAHAPHVGLRGSSMGGFCSILAAAAEPSITAVAAVCPAPQDMLRRGIAGGQIGGFEVDPPAIDRWLGEQDLAAAVAGLGDRVALLLAHARGDQDVPVASSERLYELAAEPKRLIVTEGGDHRSVQHDPVIQRETVRFLDDALNSSRDRFR